MKPKKIVIPDKALKNIPEEDREDIKKLIQEKLSVDTAELLESSQPVERLEEPICPGCGKILEASGPTFDDGEDIVQIYDCWDCDRVFMLKATN